MKEANLIDENYPLIEKSSEVIEKKIISEQNQNSNKSNENEKKKDEEIIPQNIMKLLIDE